MVYAVNVDHHRFFPNLQATDLHRFAGYLQEIHVTDTEGLIVDDGQAAIRRAAYAGEFDLRNPRGIRGATFERNGLAECSDASFCLRNLVEGHFQGGSVADGASCGTPRSGEGRLGGEITPFVRFEQIGLYRRAGKIGIRKVRASPGIPTVAGKREPGDGFFINCSFDPRLQLSAQSSVGQKQFAEPSLSVDAALPRGFTVPKFGLDELRFARKFSGELVFGGGIAGCSSGFDADEGWTGRLSRARGEARKHCENQ